jgi:hypothetical protein
MLRSLLIAAIVCLTATGMASAYQLGPFTDNFDSYAASSLVDGQGGWTDTGTTKSYQTVAGGGAGGTQGINNSPSGSNQINWTAHPWNWANLSVGDRVIVSMDFQANGSGQFDDDRVGWVDAANASSSSWHFGVQLDNTDAGGGLVTYYRTSSTNPKNSIIPWANLGASGSNWYREQLTVTKLINTLGPGGAQVDVSFQALDGSGNPVGSPVTATAGTIDTLTLRGFSGTVYPMFKNYNAQPGNADNAYFAIVPEPTAMSLLCLGGLALLRRRH